MLIKKNSLVREIFLLDGQGLGLDRFYEEDKKGFLSIIGCSITFFSFIFLKYSGYEYNDGVKIIQNIPSPLIVLPYLEKHMVAL